MSEPSTTPASRLIGALTLGVVAISFAAIFFRKATPTHPLVAAGTRLLIAAILLSPLVVRAARRGEITTKLRRYAAVGGLAYAIHFGAWVWSLQLTTVAASVTLVTATPLLLATIALISGTDRPDSRIWAALLVSAAGVAIIGGGDFHAHPAALVGDALAVLGAAAMAGYLVLCRKLKDFDVLVFTGIATAVGGAILLVACWIVGVPFRPSSVEALGYLFLAALIPQIVGHTALTWSLRVATPTVVGIATLGEPVGSTLLAFFVLDEIPPPTVVVGCAVTLVGVMLAILSRRSHRSTGR